LGAFIRSAYKEQYPILKKLLDLDNRFDWLIEQETKRYEEAQREIISKRRVRRNSQSWDAGGMLQVGEQNFDITKPATDEAKKMEGAYVGFQPKPAVEIILVISKGKTLTWLDDCRIPYSSDKDLSDAAGWVDDKLGRNIRQWSESHGYDKLKKELPKRLEPNQKGRFPANLLVSDDVFTEYSRYFSLDSWKTFPFIITPKASKSERGAFNSHPTVKPLKLFSYLITMGSREGDIVLDPFCGSGTTCIAAEQLHRKWIGIEINPDYIQIAKARLKPYLVQTKII